MLAAATATTPACADVIDDALGRPVTGDDVVLTIDSRVQKAAEQALAGPARARAW